MKELIVIFLMSFTINAQTEINYADIGSVLDVQDELVMIQYYTDWCSVCKRMEPIYEELSEKHKDGMHFYKVDVTDIDVESIKLSGIPISGFPAYACYLNDEEANDPISLWYGYRAFEIYDFWIEETISDPNSKYSDYEPLYSVDQVKKEAIRKVLSWSNRETFTAEHIHDENYDYDPDYFLDDDYNETVYWKNNWEKIWTGEIKSNYKYTYIPNPEEVLTGEDYSIVESGFWYTLEENNGLDLVVVKVEFLDEDEGRAVCFVLFDRADNIGGDYDVVGPNYPDL